MIEPSAVIRNIGKRLVRDKKLNDFDYGPSGIDIYWTDGEISATTDTGSAGLRWLVSTLKSEVWMPAEYLVYGYTSDDLGVHIDAKDGKVRSIRRMQELVEGYDKNLAEMLENAADRIDDGEDVPDLDSLFDRSIAVLQHHTDDGLVWVWDQGSLVLIGHTERSVYDIKVDKRSKTVEFKYQGSSYTSDYSIERYAGGKEIVVESPHEGISDEIWEEIYEEIESAVDEAVQLKPSR